MMDYKTTSPDASTGTTTGPDSQSPSEAETLKLEEAVALPSEDENTDEPPKKCCSQNCAVMGKEAWVE